MKKFKPFWDFEDNVDRIEESKVTPSEFIERYEKPYKPVIIQGVQTDWKAQYKWTIEVYLFYFSLIFIIRLDFLLDNESTIMHVSICSSGR